MSNWQVSTLSEVADFVLGKMLDQAKNKGELRPYLANVNVRWGDFDLEGLREMRFEAREIDRYSLRFGDIVMCEGGEPGRCAIWKSQETGLMIQKALHRIRPHNCLDGSFLFYAFLNLRKSDGFAAYFTGSTIKHLPREQLAKIAVRFPEILTQQKIAAILSAYDDLIANNQRRIALLERMAEDIYREWFVRLRFPGHESIKVEKGVPHGWHFDIGDIFFGHVKGKSYGGDELSDNPSHMPFITLKSFERGGGYRSNGLKHYSGRYKPEQVVRQGDVVMAVTDMTQNREVVGRVARVPSIGEKGAVISLDVIKLVPKTISSAFLYSFFRLSGFGDYIKEFANGTNVLHLKPDLVTQQKVRVPPSDLQEQFVEIVEPMYRQIDAINLTIAQLASTRDALLPRLISGKLAVDALDIRYPPGMANTA